MPLHPDVIIIENKNNNVILDVANNRINIEFEGKGNIKILESTYHPEFGISVQSNKLVYKLTEQLPVLKQLQKLIGEINIINICIYNYILQNIYKIIIKLFFDNTSSSFCIKWKMLSL